MAGSSTPLHGKRSLIPLLETLYRRLPALNTVSDILASYCLEALAILCLGVGLEQMPIVLCFDKLCTASSRPPSYRVKVTHRRIQDAPRRASLYYPSILQQLQNWRIHRLNFPLPASLRTWN